MRVSVMRPDPKEAHREVRGWEAATGVARAALDNPDLPIDFIAEALASLAEPREDATPFVPRRWSLEKR